MTCAAACVGVSPRPDEVGAQPAFYTVTAEIALSRQEPRVAALQYVAAAESDRGVELVRRATDVTTQCLQPSLTLGVAARWVDLEPASVDAHRAVAKAALDLHLIGLSTAHYRVVLNSSTRGADAEFAELEAELAVTDEVYGARQLADGLASYFPASAAALHLQAVTAVRADDPASAVLHYTAAIDVTPAGAPRREMVRELWRARILAGDINEPLAQARTALEHEDTPAVRMDYALLLLAARQDAAAGTELSKLTHDPEEAPAALRMLGLVEFQAGRLDEAARRFAELLATGRFLDDALYYLGVIAEQHGDLERALRFYAKVQNGGNAVPAMLRAASILRAHGAAPAAEELLDRLVEEEPARAPEILAGRARIYASAGDIKRAIALLDHSTLQYPDSVELRYAMASLSEQQGNIKAALSELKRVLQTRPDDPAALNAYGYTLADHDRKLGKARGLIEQAYASAPKNAAILDSLGWVLYRQGHGEQALTYLNEAYADDRGGDIAAHLGEVLWQLGRQADAERIWTDGSRADIDNPLLKATRLRLHAAN